MGGHHRKPPLRLRTNDRATNNLRLVVRTRALPSSCSAEVVSWILRCLEHPRLAYVHLGAGGIYPWNVVSNVVNEIAHPERCRHNETVAYPELVVAVRIGHAYNPFANHASDADGLIVVDENPPRPHLRVRARTFEEIVKDVPPPACVTALGVSAVTDEFMMRLWGEIISREPSSFDGRGGGLMAHPMWVRMPDHSWFCRREMSSTFGWSGYDPSE